ncbi:MAG: UbiX family flavin prenyltransferase [Actinomycetes bacterium]|jgi:4-hydroxy-3-polyprenylbenzoate decarboxylase|nr:UbiX family flavin prenyltransferase [Actinomycetes bacterium]
MTQQRIIVGISGASGVALGYATLAALAANPEIQTHLVVSEGARRTWELEESRPYSALLECADVVHDNRDLAASISSGSFQTMGMIVAPCSMKTLAGIVNGYSENLLLRAADVVLKENRRLVLMPREMPYGALHLDNMARAARYGATIVAPLLTFYNMPDTIEQQIDHIVGKALMQFGLPHAAFRAWKEDE